MLPLHEIPVGIAAQLDPQHVVVLLFAQPLSDVHVVWQICASAQYRPPAHGPVVLPQAPAPLQAPTVDMYPVHAGVPHAVVAPG